MIFFFNLKQEKRGKKNIKHQIKRSFFFPPGFSCITEWQLPPRHTVIIAVVSITSESEHIWLHLVALISLYGRLRVQWDVQKTRLWACLRVQACMREVCAALYASLNALSLSAGVDVCAHVCPYDGGRWGAWGWVARAGIKHARSTSQRLGGPSPALTATHVKPRLHGKKKMGQWNTTHSRTHRIHTRAPVSTQRITVCQSRQCLVACLRPAFSAPPRTSSCRTDTSSGPEQRD